MEFPEFSIQVSVMDSAILLHVYVQSRQMYVMASVADQGIIMRRTVEQKIYYYTWLQ